MGSEDTADHTISSTKATLRRVQYAFLTNRKFTFLISFVLAVITYTPIYISQNNNNNKLNRNIRYGVGGSSASDELTSALNRKTYGRAAVAIIRVVGLKSEHGIKAIPNNNEVQYLVQIKSHDYPIEAFRGAVCLVGGNVNVADNNTKKKKNKMLKGAAIEEVDYDVTPLDTLKRELNEELLHPTWVDSFQEKDVVDDSNLALGDDPMFSTTSLVADSNENEDNNDNNDDDDPRQPGTIRYLGTTLHSHTSQLLQTPDPYAFYCALYEITIGINQLPHGILHQVGANVQEGRLALLSQDQLLQHASFAWGYEYTMERYFGKTSRNKQVGASVSDVDEKLWDTTSWNPGK
jgi:hypothetical protein